MYIIMEVMVCRSRRRVEEVAVFRERAMSESIGRSSKDEEFGVARNPMPVNL